jgi:hypothetical protein
VAGVSGTAAQLGRQYLDKWAADELVDWFADQTERSFPGSPLRRVLIQSHLTADQLYGRVLDAVEADRGSVATMLNRFQLEAAAYLTWVAIGESPDERPSAPDPSASRRSPEQPPAISPCSARASFRRAGSRAPAWG